MSTSDFDTFKHHVQLLNQRCNPELFRWYKNLRNTYLAVLPFAILSIGIAIKDHAPLWVILFNSAALSLAAIKTLSWTKFLQDWSNNLASFKLAQEFSVMLQAHTLSHPHDPTLKEVLKDFNKVVTALDP